MSDKQARADRISVLMNDPDLKQAFKDVRDKLTREFVTCDDVADAYILDLKRCVEMLGVVEKLLYKAIDDGKLDEHNANLPPILGDMNVH
jgi:hypothetical protein